MSLLKYFKLRTEALEICSSIQLNFLINTLIIDFLLMIKCILYPGKYIFILKIYMNFCIIKSNEFMAQKVYVLKLHLSRSTTKPTDWPVRPAKAQISLGICPVWSVYIVCLMGSSGPKVFSCGQQRLWSDWCDAQADLSLCWVHCVRFVMPWFVFFYVAHETYRSQYLFWY